MLAKLLLGLLLLAPLASYAALLESVGIQSTAAVSSQVTGTLASAPPSGSIVVLAYACGGNGTGVYTATGFSATPISLLSATTKLGFMYKVAGASEPTSYTLTTSSSSNYITIQAWVFTGRNTTSPFTTSNSVSGAGTTSPVSIAVPTITPAAGDDILWVGTSSEQGVTMTFTQPSGYTNSLNSTGGTGNPLSMGGSVNQNVSSGATGTLTGTQAWTGGGTAAGALGGVLSIAAAGGGSCSHDFWSSGGTYAVPNGSSGSYWSVATGSFATPNCSSGTYWLKTGATGAT